MEPAIWSGLEIEKILHIEKRLDSEVIPTYQIR
jgi:hypothetical protein